MCERSWRLGRAVTALAQGSPIVLRDEFVDVAALVVDASSAVTGSVAFLIRHTSGFLTAAAPAAVWQRLRVPVSPVRDRVAGLLDYGISVDGADTGTGISAAARAATLRLLADPRTDPDDLVRPGHVMTVRVDLADLGTAAAAPAAAMALVRASGGEPVAGYAHLVEHTTGVALAGAPEATAFGARHGLAVVDVADVRGFVGTGPVRLSCPAAAGASD